MDMFPGGFRHMANDVLSDLITAFLVAFAAVVASAVLTRVWDAL